MESNAETDDIIFSSFFIQTPVNVSRLSLKTGQVADVKVNPPIGNMGGATTYNGQVTCFRHLVITLLHS